MPKRTDLVTLTLGNIRKQTEGEKYLKIIITKEYWNHSLELRYRGITNLHT